MTSFVQTIILCLFIIYLVDRLLQYLKDTYTTKKTKDIVGNHIKKYQNIMDEFNEQNTKEREVVEQPVTKLTSADLISMNNELEMLIGEEL
jgi:hypothetical protein|tara:strand:+ start:185 stop:457 length:273 start_codon:yes stop_codon:yes gene_type:complete